MALDTPASVRSDKSAHAEEESSTSMLVRFKGAMPQGSRLSQHDYDNRDLVLRLLLGLHIPALMLLAVYRHHSLLSSIGWVAPIVAALVIAAVIPERRARALVVTVGLIYCSYVVIHLSNGAPEAHLHVLVMFAFIALYQDWVPLLVAGLCVAALYVVPTIDQPSLIFAAGPALRRPWVWSAIHYAAFLGVGAATVLFWRSTEREQERATELAADLGRREVADERAVLVRRQSSYALMTNLARRNQSLIGRQLSTLDELERDERDPDVLSGLFALDHLATRMRRNAENLLVLAGAPGPTARSFHQPVSVEELLRGAAAEVEQYSRVEVGVGVAGAVAGHVVSDVAHLLAELLDNALACSPPDSQVSVGATPIAGGGLRLWVADQGIGMTATRLAEHNDKLAFPPEDDTEVGATLGFPVVRRLAARHGIVVSLAPREGDAAGLVAYVSLPAAIVVETGPVEADVLPPEGAEAEGFAPIAGRRAARRTPAGRAGRTPLLPSGAEETWFHPAPMPAESSTEADESQTWNYSEGDYEAGGEIESLGAVADPLPAAEPAPGAPFNAGQAFAAFNAGHALATSDAEQALAASDADQAFAAFDASADLEWDATGAPTSPDAGAPAFTEFTEFTAFTAYPDGAEELSSPDSANGSDSADGSGGSAAVGPAPVPAPVPAPLSVPSSFADYSTNGTTAAPVTPVAEAPGSRAARSQEWSEVWTFESAPVPSEDSIDTIEPKIAPAVDPGNGGPNVPGLGNGVVAAALAAEAPARRAGITRPTWLPPVPPRQESPTDRLRSGAAAARRAAATAVEPGPELSAAVATWDPDPVVPARLLSESVLPSVPNKPALARRVPQQALLAAGGALPQTYHPGPLPEGSTELPTRTAVDPSAASQMLSSYRAGMARARETPTTANEETQ